MTEQWFDSLPPQKVASWAGEFLAADIDDTVRELRQQADFLEGKARLLREMMGALAAKLPA